MGKVTGFLEIDRQVHKYQPASDRIRHFREFTLPMSDKEVEKQAARCMDCGVPFCHGPTGCPIHNQIPDWNDLVYNGDWETAIRNLHSTNNFPEFTGRICPAPCEEACTLNLEDIPVAIKTVEQALADKAYETRHGAALSGREEDWQAGCRHRLGSGRDGGRPAARPRRARRARLRAREPKPGGLMRYGIPDFKMEKHYIDRRVEQMQGEGVTFHCNVNVGVDMTIDALLGEHDAVLYCGGSETPRAGGYSGRRPRGRARRDAVSGAAEQARRRRGYPLGRLAVAADPGRRQACRGGRRRRYRVRLRRHRVPPGGGARDPARHPSAAAGEGETSSPSGHTGRPRCAPRRRRPRAPSASSRWRHWSSSARTAS